MTIIRASYPNSYRESNFDETAFMLQRGMWQNGFSDCTYDEVFTAFNIWLATEPFAPTFAEMNKLVKRNRNPEAFVSAETAWEKVGDAVRKYGWSNQNKAMDSFTPNIRRAIQNIGGWQRLCEANLKEWDFRRKDFLDIYEEFEIEAQHQELIPTHILKRLQEQAGQREQLLQDKVQYVENKENEL